VKTEMEKEMEKEIEDGSGERDRVGDEHTVTGSERLRRLIWRRSRSRSQEELDIQKSAWAFANCSRTAGSSFIVRMAWSSI
jgi:hypothetical protein